MPDKHEIIVNRLISATLAEKVGISSEIELSSFETGWLAHLHGIHWELGVEAHERVRSALGVPVKPLKEAWLLGWALRAAWLGNSLELIMKKKGERDSVLTDVLMSTLRELEDPRLKLIAVADVVRAIAQNWPDVWTRDIHDELRELAVEGVLELRPSEGTEVHSQADLLLCPPGPRGTRFVYARILRAHR